MSSADETALEREVRALREENRRWRQRFDQAPIGMAIVGIDGRYVATNAALGAMLGRGSDDLVGLHIAEVTHPDDLERDTKQIARTLAGDADCVRVEKRYVRPDGEVVWVSLTASIGRDADGRPTHFFTQAVDLTERRRAEEALAHLALHDPLTGLANRRLLLDRVGQALLALERTPTMVAIFFIDLDGFKSVNDRYGHAIGDQALTSAARAIGSAVRAGDTVGRLGGDEFAVLCPRLEHARAAECLAQRIGAQLARPIRDGCPDLALSASIGIACTTRSDANPETLLREADAAMYRAKHLRQGGYELLETT
jgi:diguanylate cyclase (GGDEF)-like protein/PAS domain S-box-containing protein